MHKSLGLLLVLGGLVGCGGSTHEVEVSHYEVVCGGGLCLNVLENGQEKSTPQVEGYAHQWGIEDTLLVDKLAGDDARTAKYRLVEIVARKSRMTEHFVLWLDSTSVRGTVESGFMLGGERSFTCVDPALCKWIQKKLESGERFPVDFTHGDVLQAHQVL
jgi:hypothetical protein